ncbi:hypothetical protein KIW84_055767 [Lathyrus oleraceus]|uniref:Uncharacterized protein n=1 Tax=Pisum sativum TaxID=3888 RepID=A0A9D4WZF9_PEA|nr:hypothetical protein KIW84_055767 [Pisum sativum]
MECRSFGGLKLEMEEVTKELVVLDMEAAYLEKEDGDIKALTSEDLPKVIKVKNSIWWRDIKLLGLNHLEVVPLFSNCIRGKVGNEQSFGFWRSMWISNESLSILYPNLFSCIGKNLLKIEDAGCWNSVKWKWDVQFLHGNVDEVLTVARPKLTESEAILQEVDLKFGVKDSYV